MYQLKSQLSRNPIQSRNAVAIEIVCEEMELLTLEIAYTCLKDERLPYQLRSKFCMNITGSAGNGKVY